MRQRNGAAGVATGLLALLFVLLLTAGCGREPAGTESLRATLLGADGSDAVVLQSGGHAMVIDPGEGDGRELTGLLARQGVSEVETLIVTRLDRAHLGGARTLVEQMDVGRVVLPGEKGAGDGYEAFLDALSRKKLIPQRLNEPEEIALGEADVLAEPLPSRKERGKGGASLMTTVTCGRSRLLFPADAQTEPAPTRPDRDGPETCAVLKLPRDGGDRSGLEGLIETARPGYAVIRDSERSPADRQTVELLKRQDVETFETKNGEVTVCSDGKTLEVRQSPAG